MIGPVLDPDQPAVHPPRDLLQIVAVRQFVQTMLVPEPARHIHRQRRVRRHFVPIPIHGQVHANGAPVGHVVDAPGQLDQAAPFEPHAVARLRVAQIRSPLVGLSARQFLQVLQIAALVARLSQEMRPAQRRVDLRRLHSVHHRFVKKLELIRLRMQHREMELFGCQAARQTASQTPPACRRRAPPRRRATFVPSLASGMRRSPLARLARIARPPSAPRFPGFFRGSC